MQGEVMSRIEELLSRLGDVVDEETNVLRQGRHDLLAEVSHRKEHAYLECSRALSSFKGVGLDADTNKLFDKLRGRLIVNQETLKVHIDALGEITRILSDAIGEADWDGTYSQTSHKS